MQLHLLLVLTVVTSLAAARVSMQGLHVQGNAIMNGDGVGVLIHVSGHVVHVG